MSVLDTGLAVIAENKDDIKQIIERIGISNLIASAPAIIRIMRTVSDNKDPKSAMEEIEKHLYYGAETKKKVHDFQRLHGLTADGIVGNETWNKVTELLKGKS